MQSRNIYCSPTFSLSALVICRLRSSHNIFYYQKLPFYIRVLSRLLQIQPLKFTEWLSAISGVKIEAIPDARIIEDYASLQFGVLEDSSQIAYNLRDYLRKDSSVKNLGKILEKEAAEAFAVKQTAQQVFDLTLSLKACLYSDKSIKNIYWIIHPGQPEYITNAILKYLTPHRIDVLQLPKALQFVYRLVNRFILPFRLVFVTFKWVLKRGLTLNAERESFELCAEFIEPARLGGSGFDADFFVEGKILSKKDFLMFVSQEHWRTNLKHGGNNYSEIKNIIKPLGYNLSILDEKPYLLNEIVRYLIKSIKTGIWGWFFGDLWCASIFTSGWNRLLDLLPLFAHYKTERLIYATFPNGQSGFRTDDGIITGLCRRYNTKSIGIQTRAIYSIKYEDSFDCFDLYLAWGPSWHANFPERMDYIRSIEYIGGIYGESKPETSLSSEKAGAFEDFVVSIFPSDVGFDHHYTIGYVVNFLQACGTLAEKYPSIKFVVKLKSPQDLATLEKYPKFHQLEYYIRLNNFELSKTARYNYSELMEKSSVVIAIGYTTPGSEALLAGKRALFYSELGAGGYAFRKLPNLVAVNSSELNGLFEIAVEDYTDYCKVNHSLIDGLDPFRDGNARGRGLAAILK